MVECNLAKVDVAGSNPVSRSIFYLGPFYSESDYNEKKNFLAKNHFHSGVDSCY